MQRGIPHLKVRFSEEICAETDLTQDPAWEEKAFRCVAEGRSIPVPIEPGASPWQGPLTRQPALAGRVACPSQEA